MGHHGMTGDSLSNEIAALGDDPEIRAILTEVCALTGMQFSAVAYVTEDRWIACQVEDRIEFGLSPGEELEVRKTICDEIRQYGQRIVIDDVGTDPDWWNHPVPVLYGFHSYVSLPIMLEDGGFFGTLCALDPAPRAQSIVPQLDRLEQLARRVAEILTARMAGGDGAVAGGAR